LKITTNFQSLVQISELIHQHCEDVHAKQISLHISIQLQGIYDIV